VRGALRAHGAAARDRDRPAGLAQRGGAAHARALREQGYTVRETLTSGLEPETEPFRHGDEADAVFRAAVSGSGERSRVVLTGTYRRRQLAGLVRGPERVVRQSDDALERQLWARLDNVALMIRRPAAR
jgi:hypothetical protein